MIVSKKEVMDFIEENDVKFVRMSFSDIKGNLKNIAVIAEKMPDAIEHGVAVDMSVFDKSSTDMCLLYPDLSTMSVLPWRPQTGRVIRFFCSVVRTNGTPYELDFRQKLIETAKKFEDAGFDCSVGTKCEFYLFENDENGKPSKNPADSGGYLDVAPLDLGENIRREIDLSLEEMGIKPYSSSHKRGPGQNEIDFSVSDPVTAADNMMQYKSVVKAIAAQNGYYASFMPKPLQNFDGNAFCITFKIKQDGESIFKTKDTMSGKYFICGILKYIREMTIFLNPVTNSYKRFGTFRAPTKNDFAVNSGNVSILLEKIPGREPSAIIKTPDPACNPYTAIWLLLEAGIEGIENKYTEKDITFENLPSSFDEALSIAKSSSLIKRVLPAQAIKTTFLHFNRMNMEYLSAIDKEKYEEDKFFYTI